MAFSTTKQIHTKDSIDAVRNYLECCLNHLTNISRNPVHAWHLVRLYGYNLLLTDIITLKKIHAVAAYAYSKCVITRYDVSEWLDNLKALEAL